jgi:MFS family permease
VSRERYRDAWAVPEYRAVLASFLLTNAGLTVASFATSVLIYRRTSSPLLSALVLGLAFLPHLFAGALFSALVDRVPTRRLLIVSNLLTAGLVCLLAVPGMPVAALLSVVFLTGILGAIFGSARSATLPEVLPGPAYVPGRSLLRTVAQSVQIVGLAIGGVLLTVLAPRHLLLVQSAAELGSALVLRLGTRERRPRPGAADASLLRDSLTGIRAVWREPPVRRLLTVGWVVAGVAVTPEALANPYAHDLGFGTTELGLILAAGCLGVVLGEFAGIWALSPALRVRLLVPLALLTLAPLPFFALRPGFPMTVALLIAAGFGISHHAALDQRIVQAAPEQLRARTIALSTAGLMFWQGANFALAGAVAQLVPTPAVIAGFAAVGIVAVALLAPGLLRDGAAASGRLTAEEVPESA